MSIQLYTYFIFFCSIYPNQSIHLHIDATAPHISSNYGVKIPFPLDPLRNDSRPISVAKQEHEERDQDRDVRDIELKNMETDRGAQLHRNTSGLLSTPKSGTKRPSWADRSPNRKSKFFGVNSATASPTMKALREKMAHDTEAQGPPSKGVGHALFAGIHDELEDLTPDERDQLV